MAGPILATKLFLPSTRPSLVSRPRLTRRLNAGLFQDEGFGRKLSLISAPAGYGKTTLIAEWLSKRESGEGANDELQGLRALPAAARVAWLSLDEGDNDPARFLAYLIAAMRTVDERIGESARSMLHSPQPPPSELLLTTLVNDIVTAAIPVILVLDDYHVIHSPPIHRYLNFFLDQFLPQLHVILITREDPLLPIPRLRARGQVLEVRQEDLRFSAGETAEFLDRVMGVTLESDEVAALERRTEGWITGLQLAALSMQKRDDLKGFIRAFTGSSRFILDYLIEEVFERQSAGVKAFLLKSSILERLSGPLCDAVVLREQALPDDPASAADSLQAAAILEHLEQANLFIVALDESRVWYRYHRLFAELLRHRLRAAYPGAEAELHRRASRWFEAEAMITEAIQHALAARDWGRVVSLIGRAADDLLKRGELATLIGWLQQVPAELIRSRPDVGLSYAWALLLSGRFDEAEGWLVYSEEVAQGLPELLGQVATAQAFAARSRGDNQQVIEKSEEALALLPESDLVSRSTLSLNLGLVYWHEGRLRQAVPALQDARELAAQVGNRYGSLTAEIFLARTLASQGALRQAEEMARLIVETGENIPILALAHYDLASIYTEWNDLVKARVHVVQGLEMSRRSGNVEFQNAGHLLKACLLMAQGNMLGALAEAEISHELSQAYGPATQDRCRACRVRLALAMGDVATAQQWAEEMSEDMDVNSFHRFLGLTKARLLLAKGDRAAARELLQERLDKSSEAGWGYALVAIRALQVLAAESEQSALGLLAEALRLSRPEGFVRAYVDAGEALIPFLRESVRQGKAPDYIGRILSAYDVRKKSSKPLLQQLSSRELEVLRLMAAGLSNREIAKELVISTGTAKTHVHNVCGKLGVRNRTAAATRAKELELLE